MPKSAPASSGEQFIEASGTWEIINEQASMNFQVSSEFLDAVFIAV
jgi:hypothetical protein